jgi:hypothetical protein
MNHQRSLWTSLVMWVGGGQSTSHKVIGKMGCHFSYIGQNHMTSDVQSPCWGRRELAAGSPRPDQPQRPPSQCRIRRRRANWIRRFRLLLVRFGFIGRKRVGGGQSTSHKVIGKMGCHFPPYESEAYQQQSEPTPIYAAPAGGGENWLQDLRRRTVDQPQSDWEDGLSL